MLWLRVSDIKQYVYCPRIVFYQYVMPVEKTPTFKMDYGRTAEERIDRLEVRRGLKRYGLSEGHREFHKRLSSRRLGLTGKLDLLIITPSGFYPVDFKYTFASPGENHLYQLCAYALILEDIYSCSVEKGFIYLIPKDEAIELTLDTEAKSKVHRMLHEIRDMIAKERLPESTPERNRCIDCEYRNYCGDIFWG